MSSEIKNPKLINLSLPKTSSSSLADYCNNFCFATHEAWHVDMTKAIVKYHLGLYPIESLRNFYIFRNIYFQHDVDSSTFNHFLMEDLVQLFPSSHFICIFRDPCSWVASMLNMWSGFDATHQSRLAQNDHSLSKSSRDWTHWINQYSTLYSANLSTYFLRRSNFDLNSSYLSQLIFDLLEYWIRHSESFLALSDKSPYLLAISMSNIAKIPTLLEDIFSDLCNFSNICYPRSNTYPIAKKSNFYITRDDVTHLVPQHLGNKLSSIYERLSILEVNY